MKQFLFEIICFSAMIALLILILKNADFIEYVLWGI